MTVERDTILESYDSHSPDEEEAGRERQAQTVLPDERVREE